MKNYLFFDTASTTKCSEAVVQEILKYSITDYGNPSSNHPMGENPARAIRNSRQFFADYFKVDPKQVIFTGSGSEANNLAVQGAALGLKYRLKKAVTVFCSEAEHPSVTQPARSLEDFDIPFEKLKLHSNGNIDFESLFSIKPSATPTSMTDSLTSAQVNKQLFSIQTINHITGAHLPIETIAQSIKSRFQDSYVHTDAIQAFGKVNVPRNKTAVDLMSISSHKIQGPKGVAALIIFNKKLLDQGIRPIVFGGGHESGLRAGTLNAGLISGFHLAAQSALQNQKKNLETITLLSKKFKSELQKSNLLTSDPKTSPLRWNSPDGAVPHIVSLSAPGLLSSPLIKLLAERGCIASVGSACTSAKVQPEPVLKAMGLPHSIQTSSFRISFSADLAEVQIHQLVKALSESVEQLQRLTKGTSRKKGN